MKIKTWLRENGVVLALLIVKGLTVVRTGIDTYIVSQDILNVLLVDGVFTAMWLYAAFAGDGQRAARLRPFAIAGAWCMYGFILVIGWDAHAGNPLVATAVRAAGALALLYDTWDYVSKYLWAGVSKFLDFYRRIRTKSTTEEIYNRALSSAMQGSVKNSMRLIRKDLDNLVYAQLSSQLPQLVSGQMPEPEQTRVDVTPPTTVDVYPPSIVRGWASMKNTLMSGDVFKRADIEQHMNCSRQWACSVLLYGRSQNEVEEQERGVYIYKPSKNGNGHKIDNMIVS